MCNFHALRKQVGKLTEVEIVDETEKVEVEQKDDELSGAAVKKKRGRKPLNKTKVI